MVEHAIKHCRQEAQWRNSLLQEYIDSAKKHLVDAIVLFVRRNRCVRWDQLHIRRGLDALRTAQELGGALGPYALQAAIAACHARALTPDDTDWEGIAALYDALAQVMPSPVAIW